MPHLLENTCTGFVNLLGFGTIDIDISSRPTNKNGGHVEFQYYLLTDWRNVLLRLAEATHVIHVGSPFAVSLHQISINPPPT
jgi:hypothetical protein